MLRGHQILTAYHSSCDPRFTSLCEAIHAPRPPLVRPRSHKEAIVAQSGAFTVHVHSQGREFSYRAPGNRTTEQSATFFTVRRSYEKLKTRRLQNAPGASRRVRRGLHPHDKPNQIKLNGQKLQRQVQFSTATRVN